MPACGGDHALCNADCLPPVRVRCYGVSVVRIRTPILIGLAVAAAGFVCAAEELPESRPADPCARRAAASAFAELTSRLLRLPMTRGATVGQWIGSRADMDLALRRAAYERRRTRVVSPPGASVCRVEMSVVVSEMARLWARYLRQASLASAEELEQIRQWSLQAGERRLTASGIAEGVEPPAAEVTGPGAAERTAAMPTGWEHLPPEALDLAQQAARADAAERLRARSRELQLRSGELLGEVFDLYGRFEDAFLEQVKRRIGGKPTYEPFGVCRIPAKLSVQDIGELLSLAAAMTPEKERIAKLDFASLTDPVGRGLITVEGVGVPPPPGLAWPGRSPANEAPTWVTETLTAVGQSPPGAEGTAGLGPLHAREALIRQARVDAIRNMWMQIDELMLPQRGRVRDFLSAHPEIGADLAALEGRMRDAGAPEVNAEGRISVKIVMPLAPLWDVLSRAATADKPGSRPARRAITQPAGGE